jgi:hypothetical protein
MMYIQKSSVADNILNWLYGDGYINPLEFLPDCTLKDKLS